MGLDPVGHLAWRNRQASGSRHAGQSEQMRGSPLVTLRGRAFTLEAASRQTERKIMGNLRAGIIPVTPFQQNCTVLFDEDTKSGVVVDPGGDVDVILQTVKENGLTIEAIWLTHGHIDHAGGADELRERLNVKIIGPHKDDLPLLSGLEEQARMFGLDMEVRNVTPDQLLEDGDTVSFGTSTFEVFHAPGHAPGHVIFFNREEGFAHLGDVLFAGSIGRTDLPGGDHQTLLNSIRDKVLPLGDEIGFICGHGPGSKIGDERRSNPFLKGL
jgi:glyoxylase-like metal-dependent hydrolase (beta-lactamase superfamily II)